MVVVMVMLTATMLIMMVTMRVMMMLSDVLFFLVSGQHQELFPLHDRKRSES